MFCSSCGANIPDDAHFCNACGKAASLSPSITPKIELESMVKSVENPIYAGFWARFAASFVDAWVVTLLYLIPGGIFGVFAAMVAETGSKGPSDSLSIGYIICFFVASAAYFTIMEAGDKSATYGKRWFGLKVVDLEGNRISRGRAFGRWISHFLSYITLYLGFLIQPFTKKRQALHDMTSGTIVVVSDGGKKHSGVVISIAAIVGGTAAIGVLAAVAIPAYQDYTIKAKIMEGYSLGTEASRAVEAYYLQTGNIPTTLGEVGITSTSGTYVSSVQVNPQNAEIIVTYSNTNPSQINGKTLTLMPTQKNKGDAVTWKCSSSEIATKYLPAPCK